MYVFVYTLYRVILFLTGKKRNLQPQTLFRSLNVKKSNRICHLKNYTFESSLKLNNETIEQHLD